MLSNLFFLINFTISIVGSSTSLILSFLIIFIVYKNRQLHTLNNLLLCNTCVAVMFYSILYIIASILGFREDWSFNAPLCNFRAYFWNIAIAVICYSKSIHAISRYFFAVLYKHRYLLTWRFHWILIGLSWIIGILVCIPPFFVNSGYALEQESRSCVVSTKLYGLALYITFISCITPINIIANVYVLILLHVRRSTRRVWAVTLDDSPNILHRTKREMKIMKQMIIQTSTLLPGGPIFLVLITWQATQKQPPPEWLYLLGFQLVTVAVFLVAIAQFIMSKEVKQLAIQYLCQHRVIHIEQQACHIP